MKLLQSLSFARVLTGIGEVSAQDWPYPAGRSGFEMEGLKVAIHCSRKMSKKAPLSCVVLLHGMGVSAMSKRLLTASTWSQVEGLLDPFVHEGVSGHQWLDGTGDVNLVISTSGTW